MNWQRPFVMDEFDLIETYFRPLTAKGGPAQNLENDTAILTPRQGFDLVITKDAMIEGVHFMKDQAPEVIAKRLMAANLSDLAAAGAKPLGYLLAIMGLNQTDKTWFAGFSKALKAAQKEWNIHLYGGDTTKGSKSLCLSLTAIGEVPKGQALSRKGARAGDLIFVSGTIGDAWLGLKGLKAKTPLEGFLKKRFEDPTPRVALGRKLLGLASASVDVSDGLVADLGHLVKASRVSGTIEIAKIPLSAAAKKTGFPIKKLITAGDDYELAFTVPKEKADAVKKLSTFLNLNLTQIGDIKRGSGIRVLDPLGKKVDIKTSGYKHFK